MIKSKNVAAVVWTSCVMAGLSAPAGAVVTDNFESYTVGEAANVANPSVYSAVSTLPVGVIGTGTATTNVPSSKVLNHDFASQTVGTRADGPDITDTATITFDFYADEPQSNVYVIDNSAASGAVSEAALIQMLSGNASLFYFRVEGRDIAGNFYRQDQLLDRFDWYRVTFNLDLAPNAALNTFSVSVDNLTDGVSNVYTTPVLRTRTDVAKVNRLQFETPSGSMQFDNITVPEPASLALLGLGGLLVVARSGRRSAR